MTPYSLPKVRISLIREPGTATPISLTSSQQVADLAADMRTLDREEFRIYLLDTKHHVNGVHTVSIGSITQSIVHPREVFKAAVLANSSAIVGVHNHTSGNPLPSPEDRETTKRLKQAGELLGIPLLDHIIIGEKSHYSFLDHGEKCITE